MTEYIRDVHIAKFTGPTGCGKSHFVLDLIKKEYSSILTASSALSVQRSDETKYIIPNVGSDIMTMFGL